MRVRSSDDEVDDIMETSEIFDNPDIFNDLQEYDMALFKKADKPEAEKIAKPAVKTVKPKTEKSDKPKGTFGPRQVPEGFVGLDALAKEFDLKPSVVRRKLRTAEGVTKPEGQHGWYWKDGSRELASIRKVLAPPKA